MRAPGIVAADALAGVKIYPVDYDEQIQRIMARLDPAKGRIAKQLHIRIKTLATQKRAAELRGGDAESWQKKIDERVEQIKGLAPELKEYLDAYQKIGRKKAVGE
jgi:hypothetical protein